MNQVLSEWVSAWSVTVVGFKKSGWIDYLYDVRPTLVCVLSSSSCCRWSFKENRTVVSSLIGDGVIV